MASEKAKELVAAMDAWVREETLADLMPQEDLRALLAELRGDDAYWEGLKPRFEDRWAKLEGRLRKEQRSLEQLLSPEAKAKLLEAVVKFEPDPEAIKTFLRSPAIEETLGNVLYAGISEFLKKADLIGRVVNKLPVLGPIRRKVMAVFKDELEGKLEGQIKGFLGGFSGKAVERVIESVLSEENKAGFATARTRLVEHLLQRPIGSLLPDADATARVREQVWAGLRNPPLKDEPAAIAQVYDDIGGERIGDWSWAINEAARAIWAKPLQRFWESEPGGPWKFE